MERFAAAMREARARKKMSQKELSEECGIATSTISSYESGGKVPPLDVAVRIAAALNLSIDEIWGLRENTQATNNETEFAKIVHAIDSMIDSDIAKVKITPVGKGLEATITLQEEMDWCHETTWLFLFAEKWNVLLKGRKEDPIFQEVYKPWLESQISEAKTRAVFKDYNLPF